MTNLLKIFSLILILSSCNSKNENEQRDLKEHDHNGHENHTIPGNGKNYTCPMHPEIIKNEPGQCPICKMDLVEKKEEAASEKKYTCPMHPEIVQDKPGICPKCKMDLIEMKADKTKSPETELDILLKPTNKYVISQVKTVAMKRQTIPVTIQVTGKINYDTREISTVSSKVEGRIEKLYVKYLYQPVNKGQKLMDVYSKELATEQENFIYLLKYDPDNNKLIKTAEDRLILQGLTSDQIKKIKTEKKAMDYISVYSPFSGHLHDLSEGKSSDMSSMNQQKELLIKEGTYVQKGQAVFNVYNTSKLWALLNVHSENQGLIAKGQKVNLFIDGNKVNGEFKIDFIEPEIKPNQNTVTARIYLPNLNKKIKVGSNVKGIIDAGQKTGYFIPVTAVVDLGTNHVVFLKENKLFKAHKVSTGRVLDNMIEVVSGIKENDLIAENGQLLMDSESFIKSEN